MPQRSVLWALVIGIASVACWQAAQSAPKSDDNAELYRLFVDAVENIDRSYVKPVDRKKLIESAIQGMISKSLDPYSDFVQPEEMNRFTRQTTGKFGGIGVHIDVRNGYVVVVSPVFGTPAYEAGILAGDRILAVNGESLQNVQSTQVVEKIAGDPGTEVTLTIQRKPYNTKPIQVTLKRAVINIETVLGYTHGADDRWDYLYDKENKIAYIRISSFVPETANELKKVLEQLLSQGMRGLILDLRYNPGGLLGSAVEVADLFVREGEIVSTKGRNTVDKVYPATAAGTLPEFPMAVLTNRFSASASEIVAACLQDHKRAIVVGERTWGKGSVQNVIELQEGKSALKLTTASYRRPSGANIHRFNDSKENDEWGVKPDEGYQVAFSDEEHDQYLRWRTVHDQILGKVKKEDVAKQSTSEKKPDPPKEPPKTGEDKKKEAKPAEPGDKKTLKDDVPDAVKQFDDKQFNKAIAHLREKLSQPEKKVAEAPRK